MEDRARAVGDDDGRAEHRQREELARSRARHFLQNPRDQLAPHDEHEEDEERDPGERLHDVERDGRDRNVRRSVNHLREGRQKHEEEHAHEVLHDEPADRNLPVHARRQAADFERLRDDHGRSAGNRQAEHHGLAHGPVPDKGGEKASQRRREEHLQGRARHGDALHAEEVLNGEVETHAEHQQHHADFGELLEHVDVEFGKSRDEAHGQAGADVADERRRAQKPLEAVAERKGEAEARDEARDEGVAVVHDGGKRVACPRARAVHESDPPILSLSPDARSVWRRKFAAVGVFEKPNACRGTFACGRRAL